MVPTEPAPGSTTELERELGAVREIMDRAARLALDYFQRGVPALAKPDGSAVTEADRAVEELLRRELAERWPDDALLGEELGASVPGGAASNGRRWIIDPIDGTSSFVKRSPDWRVHLALEVRGEVVLGAVVAPALGLEWSGTRGAGAFESSWPRAEAAPRRLEVSAQAVAARARLQAYPLERVSRRLPGWNLGRLTSVVPVDVVRGALDAFVIDCCDAWDHAPWVLFVQEAGGRFTDWSGGTSAHVHGGVFSNAALHTELVQELGIGVVEPLS
jgi:histidinol-phosphatase